MLLELTPLDLPLSTTLQLLGSFDPTGAAGPGFFEKRFVFGGAVVRVRLTVDARGLEVSAEGATADELLARWRAHLPPADGLFTFKPVHPVLKRLHHAFPGLRIVRWPWLYDAACGAILQQRVTWRDAAREFRRIAEAHGPRTELGLAFPPAPVLAGIPGWELERLGVDPKRARALITLAKEEARRPFLTLEQELAALRDRLLSLRGIGPWTADTVLGWGAGDLDAVPEGDLHLPHVVTWALAREPRGTDARMVELLEPVRGHRFRAIRLLYAAKVAPPRR